MNIEELLACYLKDLDGIIEKKAIETDGTVHVFKEKGKERLYAINGSKKEYLGKNKEDLARKLCQKKYEEELKCKAKKQKEILLRTSQELKTLNLDSVFKDLDTEIKNRVSQNEITDEGFAEKWQKQKYKKKHVDDSFPFFTMKGEHVRSKSEVLIADRLKLAGVPYHYEKPLVFDDEITRHPDFTILNKRTREEFIWEHLGKMDDENYCKDAQIRVEKYIENGMIPGKTLITTFESVARGLSTKVIDNLIENYLK